MTFTIFARVKNKKREMRKIYVEGEINSIRVGMCQISLSDTIVKRDDDTYIVKKNNPVVVYDTSGPYGDSSLNPDYKSGLPRMREAWYARRKDIVFNRGGESSEDKKGVYRARDKKCLTQMYYAKKRVISPEMEYVAIRENQQVEALGLKSYITPDFVRKEIASGRAVIPANINHVEVEPMILGSRFLVKINCNLKIGKTFTEADHKKICFFCSSGVDALTEISYEDISSTARGFLVHNSPVPIRTQPIFQALAKVEGRVEELTWEIYRDILVNHMEQGVDFISVHGAMKRTHTAMASNRLTGIVSQAGLILSEWMKMRKEENFLYTHFSEICEIASSYDAVISIGSGLRPGSVYDANDRAHLAELSEMRGLVDIAWKQYAQIMAEGPGHIPMNKIKHYMKEYLYICKGIPFFSSGILTSDLAVGHEHIAAAISGAQVAWYGASLIGGFKNQADVSDLNLLHSDLLSYKIAAHSADLAKGHPGAQVRDNAFSKARYEKRENDWAKLLFGAARK